MCHILCSSWNMGVKWPVCKARQGKRLYVSSGPDIYNSDFTADLPWKAQSTSNWKGKRNTTSRGETNDLIALCCFFCIILIGAKLAVALRSGPEGAGSLERIHASLVMGLTGYPDGQYKRLVRAMWLEARGRWRYNGDARSTCGAVSAAFKSSNQ